MGNSLSPHCVVCEEELKFQVPWDAPHYRTCSWCEGFIDSFNKNSDVLTVYNANDFSPLDFATTQESKTNINYRKMFTSGKIEIKTPRFLNIFGRFQNSSQTKDIGGCYTLKPLGIESLLSGQKSFRHDFGVKEEWNSLKTHIILAIPKGIQYFSGKAAAQDDLLAGNIQVYIPTPIAQLIFPASCKFLRHPNAESYQTFVKECKPAFELQQEMCSNFHVAEKIVHHDAHDHNALKTLHQLFAQVFLSQGEMRKQAFFHVQNFVEKTQLKNPEKNAHIPLTTNNESFKETWSQLIQRIQEYPAAQKIIDEDQSDFQSWKTLCKLFGQVVATTDDLSAKIEAYEIAKCFAQKTQVSKRNACKNYSPDLQFKENNLTVTCKKNWQNLVSYVLNYQFRLDDEFDFDILERLHTLFEQMITAGPTPAGVLAYLEAENFATNIKLKNPIKNFCRNLKNDVFMQNWQELVKCVFAHRGRLQKLFHPSFEFVLKSKIVSADVTCGNIYYDLSALQKNKLQKILAKCKKGQQKCQLDDEQETGTWLIHHDSCMKIEVIVTFLGTTQQDNTTIYSYEVLTLTTYCR